MPRYRKRPVTISAHRFLPPEQIPDGVVPTKHSETGYGIETIEGWVRATPGDWIITGVEGEKYPCRADIFDQTYEYAGEDQHD
jgi:hypothetical protein